MPLGDDDDDDDDVGSFSSHDHEGNAENIGKQIRF